MRFKCVSKNWLSLIQKNKHFFSLHKCRRSNLNKKILIQTHYKGNRFFTADLFKRGIEDVTTIQDTWEGTMHGPVNGLLCFVNGRKGCVLVYNLSTKEASPWIKSHIWKNNRHLSDPISGFGFDPVTQEHKVYLVWLICRTYQKVGVDVLTVGENTWRTTYQVLSVNDFGCATSVYMNGLVYWFLMNSPAEGRLDNILALDVGKEKLRLIKPPFYGIRYRFNYEYILEVDGQLAIMETMVYNAQKKVTEMRVWTYNIDQEEEEESDENNYKWIWEMIELPFRIENGKIHIIKSIPGKDLFMITSSITDWKEPPFIYFYDMKNKKLTEYGSLPWPEDKIVFFYLFVLEESIYPVGAQLPVDDQNDQMITTSLPPPPLVDTEEWSNTSN